MSLFDEVLNFPQMIEHVAVIIPVFNGEKWLEECLQSVADQSILKINYVKLSVSVYNDASADNSKQVLDCWRLKFENLSIDFIVTDNCDAPGGVGFARNRAIDVVLAKNESIEYFCFLDCDDVMKPQRIEKQLEMCRLNQNAIIGSQVISCFFLNCTSSLYECL